MLLTREENNMLEGKYGYPVQTAMEILVGLAECYEAERMIPVNSAHLLYSAYSLGKGGILFLQELAERGGRFAVPTDTNTSGLVRWRWRDFGFSEEYARMQEAAADAVTKMGGFLSDTCAPYLVGNVPRLGEHIAWNESSAIIFANSVLGARTNREGGPGAVAAAIAGRVPEYGFHLDQNRRGNLRISVSAELKDLHDYGTLGYFVGKIAQDKVPVLVGIPPSVSWDALKLLGAGMATSGSVTLYHIVGVTPEAPTEAAAFGGKRPKDCPDLEFGEKEVRETEESLSNGKGTGVDVVVLGCPHASIGELREIARLLTDKRVKPGVELWNAASRMVKAYGEGMGYVDVIEASGAKIICDVCPAQVAGVYARDRCSLMVATNSAKMTYYIGADIKDVQRYYGPVERCVEAGVTGVWR